MYLIIIIYLFIPFFKVLVQNLKKQDLRNLILVIFIFGNVLRTINLFTSKMNVTLFTGFTLNDLITYTNYVFLGYYLYTYEVKEKTRKGFYLLGIFSILLLPVADAIYIDGMREDVLVTANSIFPFTPAIAIFLLFKYNYDKWKVPNIIDTLTQKIAPLTFYIYMIHVMILEVLERLLSKWWRPYSFIERGIYYLIVFIITFALSYIVSIILNKIYTVCEKKIKNISKKGQIMES